MTWTSFLRAPAVLTAAIALSGCVIVADGDGEWDSDWEGDDWHDSEAFLMVPFTALEEHEPKHLFFHEVLPALTLEAALTNTGTEDAPWYCFGFEDAIDAEYARRRIQAMENGEALARHLLIDETCAAG